LASRFRWRILSHPALKADISFVKEPDISLFYNRETLSPALTCSHLLSPALTCSPAGCMIFQDKTLDKQNGLW